MQLGPSKCHELALVKLEMYNSIPNVKEGIFQYEVNGVMKIITIPSVSYELKDVNDVAQRRFHNPDLFDIRANESTLECIVHIKQPNVTANFDIENSIKKMLEFQAKLLEGIGKNEGEINVDMLPVSFRFVTCDTITEKTANGVQKPVLYNFFANIPPGYKIVEAPSNPVYLPISHNYY